MIHANLASRPCDHCMAALHKEKQNNQRNAIVLPQSAINYTVRLTQYMAALTLTVTP
jgi:hypothetical protein